MPASNPLTNGSPAGVPLQTSAPPGSPGDVYPNARVYAGAPLTGVQAPLTGAHNTSAQVAALVLIAFAVIVVLNAGGFRFVVDAGIGRGSR